MRLHPMRIPHDRYDWAVLYLCIAAFVCILPVGIFELWLGQYSFYSFLFVPIAGAAVFFAIIAIVKRERPLRVLLYLLGTVALCCVTLNGGLTNAIAIRYFERNRVRYDRSVAAMLASQGRKRKLPTRYEDLTFNGNVGYFQDPDSLNEFLIYLKVYDEIDNGFAYVWSRSDVWPNTVPHFEGCYVQRIGGNWFYVRVS